MTAWSTDSPCSTKPSLTNSFWEISLFVRVCSKSFLLRWTTITLIFGYGWLTGVLPLVSALAYDQLERLASSILRFLYKHYVWGMPLSGYRAALPNACFELSGHDAKFWAENIAACEAIFKNAENVFMQHAEKGIFVLCLASTCLWALFRVVPDDRTPWYVFYVVASIVISCA
eukprot:CAMPEP_0175970322 /NCGR_PEP_ID=MMETSP0108-20121206/40987_1 /TAXON_ID=195067 ORGANISM="Goniomonas pacifica, Strain CCMP1869" /NCGR_SAMPLE_ID=MMETSP0108 /ASSEMBLY_ACC=CAM_ASM_000204 /LENGTH=172 /DNA_ID=CAMNT_0017299271 /DNA_START=1 /DNA_END=515 /DNA_ORIENTATION=+